MTLYGVGKRSTAAKPSFHLALCACPVSVQLACPHRHSGSLLPGAAQEAAKTLVREERKGYHTELSPAQLYSASPHPVCYSSLMNALRATGGVECRYEPSLLQQTVSTVSH